MLGPHQGYVRAHKAEALPTAALPGRVSSMRRTGSVLLNDSLLLLAAVIWGLAFVAQRMGMDYVGPFTYNAVRFALGSLSLVPLIFFMRGKQGDGSSPTSPAGHVVRRISPIPA